MKVNSVILGISDVIESEVGSSKDQSIDKYYLSYLEIAISKLYRFLNLSKENAEKIITDFVSIEAMSLGREGYGFSVRDANDLGYSGIRCHTVDLGGASVGGAIEQAWRIVQSDQDAVVLVAGADLPKTCFKQLGDLKRLNKTVTHPQTEYPYGATLISMYALMCKRMMEDSDISIESMHKITKHFRNLALKNPRSFQYGKEWNEKQASKYIAFPYSTPMIAIVTDHGFATLITSEKKAEELRIKNIIKKDRNLYILGASHSTSAEYFTQKSFGFSPAGKAADEAIRLSGIKRSDLEYAWIYDCFTGMIISQSSSYFGESPKTVSKALEEGKIPIGDREIPINLGGGILNYQAAMSYSGVTGLLDILSQYDLATDPIPEKLSSPPKVSFLSGNGGIDSINSVCIFSLKTFDQEVDLIRPILSKKGLNPPIPEEGNGVIDSFTTVNFNPGGEIKTPYPLLYVKFDEGGWTLAHWEKEFENWESKIKLGETRVHLKKVDGIYKAKLI
jgi:acetyl-CoA acetyltransferase